MAPRWFGCISLLLPTPLLSSPILTVRITNLIQVLTLLEGKGRSQKHIQSDLQVTSSSQSSWLSSADAGETVTLQWGPVYAWSVLGVENLGPCYNHTGRPLGEQYWWYRLSQRLSERENYSRQSQALTLFDVVRGSLVNALGPPC